MSSLNINFRKLQDCYYWQRESGGCHRTYEQIMIEEPKLSDKEKEKLCWKENHENEFINLFGKTIMGRRVLSVIMFCIFLGIALTLPSEYDFTLGADQKLMAALTANVFLKVFSSLIFSLLFLSQISGYIGLLSLASLVSLKTGNMDFTKQLIISFALLVFCIINSRFCTGRKNKVKKMGELYYYIPGMPTYLQFNYMMLFIHDVREFAEENWKRISTHELFNLLPSKEISEIKNITDQLSNMSTLATTMDEIKELSMASFPALYGKEKEKACSDVAFAYQSYLKLGKLYIKISKFVQSLLKDNPQMITNLEVNRFRKEKENGKKIDLSQSPKPAATNSNFNIDEITNQVKLEYKQSQFKERKKNK